MCSLVSNTLKEYGYLVESAETGNAATELLSSKTYQIVLCDILLPDTNGLEFLSEIKTRNPDTYVILFTGHPSVDLAKEAIRQGASDFMAKPFSSTEILEAVRRAENEQRADFSGITYSKLRILHELTVANKITKENKSKSLQHFGQRSADAFDADELRIYLHEQGKSVLENVVDIGDASLADEVTWYFLASRTMQSGGEVLLDGINSADKGLSESGCFFMGTVIPTEDRELGVILVGRVGNKDRFKARDLKLLGLYAAQLGNQLLNLEMTEILLQSNKELEKINLVTSGFSSSQEMQSSAFFIANGLREFISFDAIGLFTSIDDGLPYNFVLWNQHLPKEQVLSTMHKSLKTTLGKDVAASLMSNVRFETFKGRKQNRSSIPPEFEIIKLDDYGKVNGWMITCSWQGRSHLKPSSDFMPFIIRHATSAMCNFLQHRRNQTNYLQTVTALAQTVDMKDKYTHHHSRNVTAYTLAIADNIGLKGAPRNVLWNAAILHDIGKIGIPEAILNKPGKLTDEEMEVIRTHPAKGCSILKPIKAFTGLLPAILYHHERYDGNGYPEGLQGINIPLAARILTVADSFDAMTSNRTYRKSPGFEFAVNELKNNAGTQFDPDLVEAFLDVIQPGPFEEILKRFCTEVDKGVLFHS